MLRYLAAQHGYSGSAETLGERVQIDGSPHVWFEDRACKNCLIAFIDDATGDLMQACFYPVESTRPEQLRSKFRLLAWKCAFAFQGDWCPNVGTTQPIRD